MVSGGRPPVSAVCRIAASEQMTAAAAPDMPSAVGAESAALPAMLVASRSASRAMRSRVQEMIPSIVCIRA